jgi:pimeloyl-ACP methyl ester carboxylesterase
VTKAARHTPSVESIRPWLVIEMERGHTGSVREAGRALGRFDGRPNAARHLGLPAAVVVTRDDRLVRPARQEDLAKAWGARVFDLDADHDAPVARPDAFARVMLDAVTFVATQLPAPAATATELSA